MNKIISRADPIEDFKKRIEDQVEHEFDNLIDRVNTFLEERLEVEFSEIKERLEELEAQIQELRRDKLNSMVRQ